MKSGLIAVLCIGLFIQIQSQNIGNIGKKLRKFTPEWQEIGADEAVPAGLHVRINLQTGKKEAKLLDEDAAADDGKTTSLAVAVGGGEAEAPSPSDELRRRLSRMPDDGRAPTPEEIEKVKHKFRPYEELKKEFKSLKMSVKTDLELMDELFASYQKIEEASQRRGGADPEGGEEEGRHLAVLTDLGYMVHQVDNAGEFVRAGGLPLIVYPSLNSTSAAIRSEAARLLGSAVQNNAPSQIKAVEEGAVGVLLRTLALDTAASVRASALYALGCLARRFPLAQRQLLEQGGLDVLTSLFDGDSADRLKMQVKVVTFVDDMLLEREDADATEREAESSNATMTDVARAEAHERVRQYRSAELLQSLVDSNWCGHLVNLLEREVPGAGRGDAGTWANAVVNPDLDVVEKITRAMLSLARPCRGEFLKDGRVRKPILGLIRWLKELSSEEGEDSDDYYRGLADQVKKLGAALGVFHSAHKIL